MLTPTTIDVIPIPKLLKNLKRFTFLCIISSVFCSFHLISSGGNMYCDTSNTEIDTENGKVLFEEGEHKFIWFDWSKFDNNLTQTKQYLIIDNGKGMLLDPCGVYVFTKVVADITKDINPGNISNIFFIHQNPDISRIKAIDDKSNSLGLYKFIPTHFLHFMGQLHLYNTYSKILLSDNIGVSILMNIINNFAKKVSYANQSLNKVSKVILILVFMNHRIEKFNRNMRIEK